MRPIRFICQPVLPAVFDDSLSYMELLCKLQAKLNEIIVKDNSQDEKLQELATAINELWEYVQGTAWEDAICNWVNDNLPCIVAQTCKWFHFGISDNGNVVCTIPLSWQDFNISWNMDFDSPDFGRLTIGW